MGFTSAIIGAAGLADTRGRAAGGRWAIVPVKRFDLAKLRLAGLLGDAERALLARTMLGDVLLALRTVETLAGILVVTGDESAARLAHGLGAEVAPDPAEPGINAAIEAGMRVLAGRASAVIVVPGDVPQLAAADLDAVIASLVAPAVIVAPASRDGGTNLLAAAPASALTPRFGPGSFARHVEAARQAGIEPLALELASLGLDLDRPDDLAAFLALRSTTRTHEYLASLEIESRLRPVGARPSTERAFSHADRAAS